MADGLELGVDGGLERLVVGEFGGEMVADTGEIEPGEVSSELVGGLVVGQGCFLGRIEGAEPEAGSVLGESDLGDPFAPVALAHSSVELVRL